MYMIGGTSAIVQTVGIWRRHFLMADEAPTVQRQKPDDRELLRCIREGETERYADLIARYQPHVVRIVARRVPSDHVEETVHDVFVRAYMGLAQFSNSVSIDHWLAVIAVRTCYDFWRARKRDAVPVSSLTGDHQRWIDEVLAAESEDRFQERVRSREAGEVLEWALGHLSPEHRAVLTLIYLEGESVREAARLLGWSQVTVKVRAYRARQALRKVLNATEEIR